MNFHTASQQFSNIYFSIKKYVPNSGIRQKRLPLTGPIFF
ncbi:hypothetical protein D1BOALGB6SA_1802 [Olavius sp. associated proteobacterium Delta 1]|nr:hypothetical protein D1BOALGB6SA_1802 [Olavius sp. associated proteobacterium Delta 1]